MWRRTVGTIAFSLSALGADVPPPARVPALPLSAAEDAKREALAKFGAARFNQKNDDAIRAAKNLEAAAKLDPSALAPSRELVKVYADLGRDAAAIRTAKKVLEADPQDADTAHHLAKLLFEVKRFSEAGSALAAAIDSPKLANRPTKTLAMRTDLARCRERANDSAGSEIAWRAVREFLRTDDAKLLKDGFKRSELDAEAASAAEKHGQALLALKRYDQANGAYLAARDLFADVQRANDRAGAARSHWNLAELASAKGEAAAAIKHLEAFLEFKPRNPEPYEKYAEQLRKAGLDGVANLRGRTEPAAKWAMLAELSRTPAGFGEAHSQFAELATEANDPTFFRLLAKTYSQFDSGSGMLEIAESLFPHSPNDSPRKPKVVSGAESARRQAFATALVAHPAFAVKVTQAARLSGRTPRSPELWDLLGWACSRAGKPDVVESALRTGYQSDPNFRSFQRYHRHLYSQRKWQEIVGLCNSAQGLSPGVLNFYRAAPLAELGEADAALRAIEKAEGDNAFASRREKVHVLDILGRHDEMLKVCDAAMEEFRTPTEVHSLRYLRSQAFLGLKKYREAEEELRGILEDDADDALALNNLGYNLADQNRKLDEAERLIRRAIEIDSDDRARAGEPNVEHAAYLDSLGWVLFRKGKLAEAREQLEKAAALPDGATDPTVWDHLGDVAFRAGDSKRAKEAWTKAAKQYESTHVGREGGRREEAVRKLKLVE